jgi:hypothetical protein
MASAMRVVLRGPSRVGKGPWSICTNQLGRLHLSAAISLLTDPIFAKLQQDLGRLALSSLGRLESHVIATPDALLALLYSLAGREWLVCCPENNMMRVALKTARRQGATRARCRCASQLSSNAGVGLFSAQPFGPQSFGCRPALLAPPLSQPIQALRSRLGRRPNPAARIMLFPGQHTKTSDRGDICRIRYRVGAS